MREAWFRLACIWLWFWWVSSVVVVLGSAYYGVPITWFDIANMCSIGLWGQIYRWQYDNWA